MRKIPIPIIIAAAFIAAVTIYLVFIVNNSAPPIWTTAANTTLVFVTPQTYFIYGTEFNRIADGKSLATVNLGSRVATIAINNTAAIPWFIVGESKYSGTVSGGSYSDTYTVNLPILLAMAYNESQIASRYGANTICVTVNGTSVTLAVNTTSAPGYIALGYYYTGTSYGRSWGLEVEYYYIGKVVAPNGFTWYMYLAAPLANAATGKISMSTVGCNYKTSNLYLPFGTLYGVSTSGYLTQVTVQLETSPASYTTFTGTQAANVTASTTPVSVPAGAASTIYGPDGIVIGIAEPLESYAFPVKNGPVKITYNP